MFLGKRWLVLALAIGAALAYARHRRHELRHLMDNVGRYSAPNAALYDTVTWPVLNGFFTQVAHDLIDLAPGAQVLEVGSGPGRLAVKLAALAPRVEVTGVDITPEMVARADALAERSGVADRVTFGVGDVAALPFPDASFDAVVSTLSAHHWQNPAQGLAEIYRVLRPGSVARIYDFGDWLTRGERAGPSITEIVSDSPFGDRGSYTRSVAVRIGPFALIYLTELRHDKPDPVSDREQ